MAALWWVVAGSATVIALFSYRYVPGVGPLAPNVMANMFARGWLIIHVAAASTAMLLVAPQLLPGLRRKAPAFHRWSGRIYALACLVGATSGLALAIGSTAGPIATAGFGLLALAWFAATAMGWRTALQRRFAAHREWMIRSFALTLAAMSLRFQLPMIPLFELDFLPAYRAISFLCWVPNIILAELWVRQTRKALAESADKVSSRAKGESERSGTWVFAGS
jgi:hypothetical protein